jgi:chemotaxis response regulator CheB
LEGPALIDLVLNDQAFLCLIPPSGPARGFSIANDELEKSGVAAAWAELRGALAPAQGILKVLCLAKYRGEFARVLGTSGMKFKIVDCVRDPHIQFLPAERRLRLQPGPDFKRLLAIGLSTGGTDALRALLTAFPAEIPPTLVVQHIPAVFSAALAQRLNSLVPFEVKEAQNGDLVCKNRVLIAPGGFQMRVVAAKNGGYIVTVDRSPPVNRHQPSVDVLFESVAKVAGRAAVGVIMTGMGADGAMGLKQMRDRGARTIAQSEDSCVIFGMPKEAIRLVAAEFTEHLDMIPSKIFELLRERKKKFGRSA